MNKEEERFELLDHWLLWYGGFNATQIGEALGISRRNVSLLIRHYKESRPEGTLKYDPSRKMHVPGEEFEAKKQDLAARLAAARDEHQALKKNK